MSTPTRIFIVGHNGAGKGVLAESLAKALNYSFINADVLGTVAQLGRQTADVIGSEGEILFNQTLVEILTHQTSMDNIVVTTDENLIQIPAARHLLANEFTVYAHVSPAVQMARLSNYRPLLPNIGWQKRIETMHTEQEDLYQQTASLIVNTDDGQLDAHTQYIVDAITSLKKT